jgi:glycosyltransferase involved in cell wall biosynthesis
MRVAWLCPFPVRLLPNAPSRTRNKETHPSTWIVVLSRALSRLGDCIELHLVTESTHVRGSFTTKEGKITYHVVRSGSTIPFTERGFPAFLPVPLLTRYMVNRKKLFHRLCEIEPDIVHAHGTEGAYALAAIDSRMPTLVSVQGVVNRILADDQSFLARRSKSLEIEAIKKCSHFVAKSPFAEQFIKSVNPTAAIFSIENPVHSAFLNVQRHHASENIVGFVGTIVPKKGIEDLIGAMALVPNAELRIIGWGPRSYVAALKKKAASLGIDRRVTWLGQIDSSGVALQFAKITLLALPSYMETSSNVIAEAMTSGVPVVATSIGGNPSMVVHDATGLLVEPGRPKELARAIQRLLDSPEIARGMGQKARKAAIQRFDESMAAKKTMAAYEKILTQSRSLGRAC